MTNLNHSIDHQAVNDWLQKLKAVMQQRASSDYSLQFGQELLSNTHPLSAGDNDQETQTVTVADTVYALFTQAKDALNAQRSSDSVKDSALSFTQLTALMREGFVLAMDSLLSLYQSRLEKGEQVPSFETWNFGHNQELRQLFTEVSETLRFKECMLIDALYTTNLFQAYWPENYAAAMAESQAKSDKAFQDFNQERGRE